MRLCIVTLLLVSVGLALTEDKSNRTVTFCQNPVPGVARMTRGVDITNMDLFSIDKSTSGFRRVVFDLTCNKGKKFHHGTLNKDFDWPDQAVQINTSPYGYQKITSNFTKNVRTMNKVFSNQAKINGGLFLHRFTDSNRLDTQTNELLQNNRKIVENTAFVDSIEIDFGTKFTTSPSEDLIQYLNHLPATYEEDPELYQELVETFGTHYIESGGFGGVYQMTTLVEESLLKTTSSKEIENFCQTRFLLSHDAQAKTKYESEQTNQDISKNTSATLQYYGGLANLQGPEDKGQFLEWQKSVAPDPWLFTVRLVPITAMIKNRTLSHQVKRVVDGKLYKAACTRAKTTLESLQEANPKMHQIDDLLDNANVCIDKEMPSKKESDELYRETEKLVKLAEQKKGTKLAHSVSLKLGNSVQVIRCKDEILSRCDPKRQPSVKEDLGKAIRLQAAVNQVATDHFVNHDRVFDLSAKAHQLLSGPKSGQLRSGHLDPRVASLCKDAMANVTSAGQCSLPLVKKELQSYFG